MDGNFEDGTKPAPLREATQTSPLLRVVPDFEKIDGWLKLDVCELLFAAAAAVRSGCIVEVGSYRGRSTIALCAGSAAGGRVPVYAIDPHEHFVGAKGGVFGPSDRKAFFKNMLTTRLSGLVRLINATSAVVGPGWDKPVSLLFIDGDHRYEAVLSDFRNWRPHLVDGAFIVFHDATGTGTELLIRDLVREEVISPIQAIGRLAMFRFNAVDAAVGADEVPRDWGLDVYPAPAAPAGAGDGGVRAADYTFYGASRDYLYQAIPKCACPPIYSALLELEGLSPQASRLKWYSRPEGGLPCLDALPASQQGSILSGTAGTFKFVVVRDPFAKLASAYSDKIAAAYARGDFFWIDQIKAAASRQGVTLSETISFPEFVRVVAGQPEDEMDIHWRPQYRTGRFDTIKYDFVARTEMLSTDFAYVLERLEAPAAIMHRAIQPRHETATTLTMWSLVSGDIRRAFLQTFAVDFDALRYPMRHASVLFAPVNVDRPKPEPLALPHARQSGLQRRLQRKSKPGRLAELRMEAEHRDEDEPAGG
jgi:predicted O-methyltransferase YrrM